MEKRGPVEGAVVTVEFGGFFEGKTVLVTGHTGFVGSWLCAWLRMLGAGVCGYSLPPPTEPAMFDMLDLDIDDGRGDVRDSELVRRRAESCRPDAIIHLAAQPLVRRSYREPLATFETNVMGTANVLEAARTAGAGSCVLMTSDKCYLNREDGRAHSEGDRLGGRDPYSASKACAELAYSCWKESFMPGGAVSTVRAGNVVGGGDWAEDRLVPDCVRAASAGSEISVRNPDSVRPWQHVLEPVSAILHLAALTAADPSLAGPYNVGPSGTRYTAGQVAGMFCQAWGARWRASPEGGAPEAETLRLDPSKITGTGWRPVLGVPEAVEWTVEWHRACTDGRGAKEVTEEQIRKYCRLAKEAKAC